MQNILGNPVDGGDFFGRSDEITHLVGVLESGNHVLLVGPRRVGKSSLVAEVSRQLTAKGWTAVNVDVQHVADEAAFLTEIHEAIRNTNLQLPLLAQAKDVLHRFGKLLRGTKVSVGETALEVSEGPADWESAATSLKSLIATLPDAQRRVMIAIDELPIFLTKLMKCDKGEPRVRAILDWLRSVRQASGRKLPWILCGSIGLDTFVARHRLEGSINELLPMAVDALELQQAIDLLKRLGERPEHCCHISDAVAHAMVQKVGWPIPYYLQLMFHGLKTLPTARRSATFPNDADVAAAYDSLMDPHHRMHFGHWDARLADLLDGNEEPKAREILTHLAKYPNGRTSRQLRVVLAKGHPQSDPAQLDGDLRDLLDFLERDGYLGRSAETFAFRSFLLRDYWQRRFGA